jgi:hypothetical protein
VERLCTKQFRSRAIPLEPRLKFGYYPFLIALLISLTALLIFGSSLLKRSLSLIVVALGLLGPAAAGAATVSPTAIPDGTYTVKVEKIVDSKHVQVVMDNGSETTLAAGRSTVDFSKVQPADQIKVSLIQGTVMVYLDLTSH